MKLKLLYNVPVSNAPVVLFRIIFGVMMTIGIIRFWHNGWIATQYIHPWNYFPFYGFEFLLPLKGNGMYYVFSAMALSSVFIALGLLYRISSITFFILFTYVELVDKTNYLNHYYFISLVAFLLIFIPANQRLSLDVKLRLTSYSSTINNVFPNLLKFQMLVVYFFAGLAKINYDWLFLAQPLSLWLPAKSNLPLFGKLVYQKWFHYFISWCGVLYDLIIPFLLIKRKTVYLAYGLVIIFHVLTIIFFPVIGMFPFIMMVGTWIFLPQNFHEKLIMLLEKESTHQSLSVFKTLPRYLLWPIALYCLIQLTVPFRYVLYPGKLFWNEEGFRFSWRVMLMEKSGTAFFYVKDKRNGKSIEINNRDFLTKQQEKMMATQPDMIVQYAHILGDYFKQKKWNPEVKALVYVNLNGRGSKLFINPDTDLYKKNDSFKHKEWIME